MTLFIAVAFGFILHLFFPHLNIQSIQSYDFLLYTLLAIGLYGAVYGIELTEFYKHRLLILRAVTLGVILKSLIVGGIFWLLFHSPYALLFGIIVAQIDPLSVAQLIDKKAKIFSDAGRTILRAWSSFDDPMTVLLALYLFLPFVIHESNSFSFSSYFIPLGMNLLFAGGIYLLSRIIKKYNIGELGLLLLAFLVAIPFKLILGIALIGLFLRPTLNQLPLWISTAFIISGVILGSLFEFNPTYLLYGFCLGSLAFLAQIVTTFLVAPTLNRTDKLFLAFAQYNGITSIILALIIAAWIPETIHIVAIAVLFINLYYYVTNYFLRDLIVQHENKHIKKSLS